MAARDRFSKKLTCPQCGHTGIADVSENDDPKRRTPGFAIDIMPAGFVTEKASSHQETYILRCSCSRKFAFRTITAARI